MLKRWSAIWLCCTVPFPPSCHCPLLPITVPSSPSLSPPPHHCSLLPITVPSSPSLFPPPHHCPLLPITVPFVLSFPSLSPPPHHCPSHHVIMADCFSPTTLKVFPPPPNLVSLKELLLSVSEVYRPRWSASSSGSRLSGDHLVWARDWTHLDEQCGMDCQPPSR